MPCAINLDLSALTPVTKTLITESIATTAVFQAIDNMSSVCGQVNLQLEVTPPAGGDATIITLPVVTVASLKFASSLILTNADIYSIKVKAGFGASFATVVASGTTSFTYVNPCSSILPIPVSFGIFTTSVLVSTKTSSALWNDAASATGGVINACGAINYVLSVTSGPTSYLPSMSSIFTTTSTTSTVEITILPTIAAEVGSYTLSIKGCLADYST